MYSGIVGIITKGGVVRGEGDRDREKTSGMTLNSLSNVQGQR